MRHPIPGLLILAALLAGCGITRTYVNVYANGEPVAETVANDGGGATGETVAPDGSWAKGKGPNPQIIVVNVNPSSANTPNTTTRAAVAPAITGQGAAETGGANVPGE